MFYVRAIFLLGSFSCRTLFERVIPRCALRLSEVVRVVVKSLLLPILCASPLMQLVKNDFLFAKRALALSFSPPWNLEGCSLLPLKNWRRGGVLKSASLENFGLSLRTFGMGGWNPIIVLTQNSQNLAWGLWTIFLNQGWGEGKRNIGRL